MPSIRPRHNDFAPRIGVAYSPDSKTVIRAAYGEFFMQDVGNSIVLRYGAESSACV